MPVGILLSLVWLQSPETYSLTNTRSRRLSIHEEHTEADCGTHHYVAMLVREVSMVFLEAYQGMMQQNRKHLERMMRAAALETTWLHTGIEGILLSCVQAFKWGLAGVGVCNTTAHYRAHANMWIHTNRTDSATQKHTVTLSRDTKIPPIRCATEQLGWDLEQKTHTHTRRRTRMFRYTHRATHVRRRIHGRLSFKSQWCGKETSGREGRRLEKETNDTETHRHAWKQHKRYHRAHAHSHRQVSVFIKKIQTMHS